MNPEKQQTTWRIVVTGLSALLCLVLTGTAVYASLSASVKARSVAAQSLDTPGIPASVSATASATDVVTATASATVNSAGPTQTATATAAVTATGSATATSQCPPLTWHTIPGPSLVALAVVSPTDAWGVSGPSVWRWDGATWSTAVTFSGDNLVSISATSSDDVWVVGTTPTQNFNRPVARHWDGLQWMEVPTPCCRGYFSLQRLRVVRAFSANDAWAAGQGDTPHYSYGDLFHWDGKQWSFMGDGVTYDFAFLSANDVWAVGQSTTYSPCNPCQTVSMTQHWDGTRWTQIPNPPSAASYSALNAVSAISPNDVWAVGSSRTSGGAFQTLVEHWDGTQWALVPTPDMAGGTSVSARRVDDVWASGPGGAMHWNGQTWQAVPEAGSNISALVVYGAEDVWAVGSTLRRYSRQSYPDVSAGTPFYPYIESLTCRGIITGYPDGTFRPGNPITRGQLSKLVANSAGFNEDTGPQIFEDVPTGSPFYAFINRLYNRGVMGGFPCGTVPTEPCNGPNNLPYFRPGNNASRGQLSKIVSNAARFSEPHSDQTFEDVGTESTFYIYVQRLATRGALGGYACAGTNPETGQPEPCVAPGNRPYFRPLNTVTRGQSAKFTANTFFPGYQTH